MVAALPRYILALLQWCILSSADMCLSQVANLAVLRLVKFLIKRRKPLAPSTKHGITLHAVTLHEAHMHL